MTTSMDLNPYQLLLKEHSTVDVYTEHASLFMVDFTVKTTRLWKT